MGEAGVAIAPDANSGSINPSKLAFLEEKYGFSASYSPWLRSIVSDINLGYLSGFYKLDDRTTLAASMRYFSLGKIQLTDANQQDLGTSNPSELAIDATFCTPFWRFIFLWEPLSGIFIQTWLPGILASDSNLKRVNLLQ